ncbi:MAG: hypothetical protein WBA05_09370 [Gordonia sp. (in: high G+C Gram-positive bacteria)]|uniref:hypothetical protein n=1 Tax=Gordonia sp. (in: high G+C Gram-positive bacteria) TaxID=84139 RepID=UPI003C773F67
MQTRTRRVSGAVLAGAAVLALTTACGSDRGDGRAAELTLTQAELPGGFTAVKLGKDEIQSMADQLHDATAKTTVSPSGCAAPGSVAGSVDTGHTGLMAARSRDHAISESVVPVVPGAPGTDLTAARERVSGQCRSVRVEVGAGPIKDARIDVGYTVLPSPVIRASQTLVVESASHTVHGRGSGTSRLLVGRAVVGGYAVTVQMSSLAEADLDRAAFEKIFAAAVDKVAA